MFGNLFARKPKKHPRPRRLLRGMEPLEPRVVLASLVTDLSIGGEGFDYNAAALVAEGEASDALADRVRGLHYRQFPTLTAAEIIYLTPEQVASIPNRSWFLRIESPARAALTPEQVRALRVHRTGLSGLTETQIAELSVEQIQSLPYREFQYLSAEQTPHLTAEGLAEIPNRSWFLRIDAAARAALTPDQVRGLRVDKIGLSGLTETQIAALSIEQIQSLPYRELHHLTADQTPSLTADQLSTIPSRSWFLRINEAARAALKPDQVRALRVDLIGLSGLTPEQIAALSIEQIQSLSYRELQYLNATQTPHLTAGQLSAIPSRSWFLKIDPAARAALTPAQVRALRVDEIGLSGLTEAQVAELSVAQIQTLGWRDFGSLSAPQIVHLTAAQIAGLPHSSALSRIPENVRAVLTDDQIRHLKTADVSIKYLTPRQRRALTGEQIQAAGYGDLQYLGPDQIVQVTNTQIASIPNWAHFRRISDESRAALNRDQLLSLDGAVVTQMLGLPAAFAVPEAQTAAADHGHGNGDAGPHPDDPEKRHEHLAVLALVPHDAATHVSVASGNWSDANTWKDGLVPPAGARVLIADGHTVTFDSVITPDQAVFTVRVDGVLQFDDDQDTQLAADTIVVDPDGRLIVGTMNDPIDSHVAARIVFADRGDIDLAWDPNQLSRGLVSHGAVEMYGEFVTPYTALAVDPLAGDTSLELAVVPENWRVGDRLVLTGTQANYARNQDEELEIVGIQGMTLLIDADSSVDGIQALAYDHVTPDGDDVRSPDPYQLSPVGDLFQVYVANMNRNVVLMSETPEINGRRGHVMFMHNQNLQVHNVGLYGLGRTDKRNPANDPVFDQHGHLIPDTGLNPRGRYAFHVHRAGASYDDQPAWVTGSVVVDSPGWAYVNHESFVHMHNNVAFHVVGAGFVTELGNEIGSMVGNLSINNSGSGDGLESREEIFDFGHGGHGFWLQGAAVEVRDNIAVGSADGAFVFFTQSSKVRFDADLLDDPSLARGRHSVPVGTVPLKSVEDNVAFAANRGLETWFHLTHMNDGQSYIDGFRSWNTRREGVFTPYTGRTTIQDAVLIGNTRRPGGTAIGRNDVTNQMTYRNVTALGFQVGISVPVNRHTMIEGGHFAAVRAIQINRARDTLREVDIVGHPHFETLTDAQLRDRPQFDIFLHGGFEMDNFDLETLFTPDIVRLGTVRFNDHQVFYYEQAADYVPFEAGQVADFVPAELLGKTNTELFDEFGIALAGAIAPHTAARVDRINGLVGPRVDYPERLDLKSRKYTNQLGNYVLQYVDPDGNLVAEPPIDLRQGWNLLTRTVGGDKRTFFVFGDTIDPTFRLRPGTVLAVNPDGLRFGFTVRGTILDNSFGHKSFKKRFDDLESRPIVTRDDGSQFILLEFTIKDLAGNTTTVSLELNLDPNAPLVPGTGQRDLPPRDLPQTLYELLQFYLIVDETLD